MRVHVSICMSIANVILMPIHLNVCHIYITFYANKLTSNYENKNYDNFLFYITPFIYFLRRVRNIFLVLVASILNIFFIIKTIYYYFLFKAPDHPIIIQNTSLSRVWFKQDDEFLLPKANLSFEFVRYLGTHS